MKERPDKFIAALFHEPLPFPEVANYLQELHEYLWAFVRAEFPWANGNMKDFVDCALAQALARQKVRQDKGEL